MTKNNSSQNKLSTLEQITETIERITTSLIPVFGSVIKEVLIDHPKRVSQARINSFVEELQKEI